jgi:hypothetical protein
VKENRIRINNIELVLAGIPCLNAAVSQRLPGSLARTRCLARKNLALESYENRHEKLQGDRADSG